MAFVNKEGVWSVEFSCDDFLQLTPKADTSLDVPFSQINIVKKFRLIT